MLSIINQKNSDLEFLPKKERTLEVARIPSHSCNWLRIFCTSDEICQLMVVASFLSRVSGQVLQKIDSCVYMNNLSLFEIIINEDGNCISFGVVFFFAGLHVVFDVVKCSFVTTWCAFLTKSLLHVLFSFNSFSWNVQTTQTKIKYIVCHIISTFQRMIISSILILKMFKSNGTKIKTKYRFKRIKWIVFVEIRQFKPTKKYEGVKRNYCKVIRDSPFNGSGIWVHFLNFNKSETKNNTLYWQ